MPSSTTSNPRWFYVYVLESQKDLKRYIGFTTRLSLRMEEHQRGRAQATAFRRPLQLIYAEVCLFREDAERREHYLKTTGGRRFLAKRLKSYYKQKVESKLI